MKKKELEKGIIYGGFTGMALVLLLVHFLILINGRVYLYEPILFVKVLEVVVFAGLSAFGFYEIGRLKRELERGELWIEEK